MRAWIFQDPKQKAKLGDECPWSVGWYDPDGKRKGKRLGSKSAAEKYQRKVDGQLSDDAALYQHGAAVESSGAESIRARGGACG